jgi:hypothetical protein
MAISAALQRPGVHPWPMDKIRDPRAAESLQLACKDTHATVRQAAETALAELAP